MPPFVLANAEIVSQMLLGSPPCAALTSRRLLSLYLSRLLRSTGFPPCHRTFYLPWHHPGTALFRMRSNIGLFGGSCGLTPWRRCRPGSGATRAESVFPTKREGPARGCRRHAMAVEALVPPGAARVAIRIATRVATVYTNAPKRRREAVFADLCTLLRPHGRSRDQVGPRVPRYRRPHGPRDARAA